MHPEPAARCGACGWPHPSLGPRMHYLSCQVPLQRANDHDHDQLDAWKVGQAAARVHALPMRPTNEWGSFVWGAPVAAPCHAVLTNVLCWHVPGGWSREAISEKLQFAPCGAALWRGLQATPEPARAPWSIPHSSGLTPTCPAAMLRPFADAGLERSYQLERQERLADLDSEHAGLGNSAGQWRGPPCWAPVTPAQQPTAAASPRLPKLRSPSPAAVRAAAVFVGLWLYDLLR